MADAATAVPSLSDSLTGYQAGLQQHTADVEKELGVAKGAYEDRVKKIDAREATLDDNAMKPPTLTPPPQPQATSPIQIWGSAAMWIAALGGIMTRRPLTNSLNAMAGVMKAYREMDQNAAQTSYDVWKVENENAVKMAQFTVDQYKTALSRIQDDRKGALDEFTVTAKALGDENAAWVAQHYGIDGAVRYNDAMSANIIRAQKATADIDLKKLQFDNFFKIKQARDDLAKAQKIRDPASIAAAQSELSDAIQEQRDLAAEFHPSSGGAGSGGLSDAAITQIAEQYLGGDKQAIATISYRDAADRDAVRNKIADLAKARGLSGQDVATKLATFDTTTKAFATKQQGNMVRSFSVLLSHFDTLKKVYTALNNGDQRTLNALKNKFAIEFGYAQPTNVDGARQIIGAEIIKAVTGAAGALGDRETAEQTINLSSSPEQVFGLLDTYKTLAVGQLKGLQRQYESGSGLKDFGKMLSPEARSALGAGSNDYPLVKTQKEFDDLKPGAVYREEDGNLYTKS